MSNGNPQEVFAKINTVSEMMSPTTQSEIGIIVRGLNVEVLKTAPLLKPSISLFIPFGYIRKDTKPYPIKFLMGTPAAINFSPKDKSSSTSDLML